MNIGGRWGGWGGNNIKLYAYLYLIIRASAYMYARSLRKVVSFPSFVSLTCKVSRTASR